MVATKFCERPMVANRKTKFHKTALYFWNLNCVTLIPKMLHYTFKL